MKGKGELKRITEEIKDLKIEIVPEEKKEIQPEESATELKRQKNIRQINKDKFIRLGFWDRRKLKRNPEHSYLITMLFANGTCKQFVIKTNTNKFKMKDKLYYLHYEEAFYNISQSQYNLFYHEQFSVPINREVQQIAEKEGDEAYFNVKPANLKALIDFEYVKVLAQSQQITKVLRILLILGAINVIGTVLMVLLIWGANTGG